MNNTDRGRLQVLLNKPSYEILPIKGWEEAVDALPAGTSAYVTCSPKIGLDRSLDIAVQVKQRKPDAQVVAHVAARRVEDDAHVQAVVDKLRNVDINDVFVIAGDATDDCGQFASGLELIRTLRKGRVCDSSKMSIGIPAYPDGHSFISDEDLQQALQAKLEYGDYMVTQLCFDPKLLVDWLLSIRAQGIKLPVKLSIPGIVNRMRLMRIAMRLGIGPSTRFLKGNRKLAKGLLGIGGNDVYQPAEVVNALLANQDALHADIKALHFASFNEVAKTEEWRNEALQQLQEGLVHVN